MKDKLLKTAQSSKFQVFIFAALSAIMSYLTGAVDGPTMLYVVGGAASVYIFGKAYEDSHTTFKLMEVPPEDDDDQLFEDTK